MISQKYKITLKSPQSFYHHADIGTYAHITQRCDKTLEQMVCVAPMLVYVTEGQKSIILPDEVITLESGQIVIIPANQRFAMINHSRFSNHKQAGQYKACMISWQPKSLQQFEMAHPETPLTSVKVLPHPAKSFLHSLQNLSDLFSDSENLPDTIISHRFEEILLWLMSQGIGLSNTADAQLSLRVRQFLLSAPDKKWSSKEVADEMAMSEATMRRHLSAENTSLTELITDIRMNHGLMLLQTTQWPVQLIALESGYDSGSRFSIRFKERFGFSPGEIRGKSVTKNALS